MKKLLIFFLIAIPLLAQGQKIDRYVTAAAGEYYEATSTNITWTLGELVVGTYAVGDLYYTQGIHQGNLVVTSIGDTPAGFVLKAYPNPVLDILFVETEKQDLDYRLLDIHGKVLENGTIGTSSFELDFTGYPSGIYFLWVEENQTHKIIKK